MAFGGVPTGNMNAKLAPKVNGMTKDVISNPYSNANAATNGVKIETMAKFDNTSEANTAPTITISKSTK